MPKRNKFFLIFIFIIGFSVRLFFILSIDPDRPIEADGKYYYETAINIANGKGYTWNGKDPFFFREPGVIFFYATCLKIYSIFENEIIEIPKSSCNLYMWTLHNINNRKSIIFIRIIQALLQSVTILIFYFVIKRYVHNNIAFFTFIFLSFFPPYLLHVFSILRETFLSFVLMLATLSWVIYLEKKQLKWLMLLGILWGISALTFQIYVLLGFVFIGYLTFTNINEVKNIILHSLTFLLIFFLTILPWLIKVYNYFPDVRIVKTLGTSLTHEQNQFTNALKTCDNNVALGNYYVRFMQDKCEMDYRHIMWYNEPPSTHFSKSFNGTYKREAERLIKATSKAHLKNLRIAHFKQSIKQSFFRYGTENLIWTIFGGFKYWKIFFYISGVLSLFGIIIYFLKFFSFSLIYFFHIALFLVIGDEARRMLPIQPFLIFFFIVSFFYLIGRIKTIHFWFCKSK